MIENCPHCGQPMPVASDSEPLRLRICGWFKRRPNTTWTESERTKLRAAAKLNTPEADLVLLDQWYADPSTYKRRAVATLLNNWNTEIDRARAWADQKKPARASYAQQWKMEQKQTEI